MSVPVSGGHECFINEATSINEAASINELDVV